MKDRLDDLFSPDRLRQRWDAEPESPILPATPATSSPPPPPAQTVEPLRELHRRIADAIDARFPGELGEPVRHLMAELRQRILRLEPEGEDPAPTSAERAALSKSVGELLAQIEDLSEAFDLKQRRG